MKNKRIKIKLLSIIIFILSIGPISWIVYGNDEKDINYSIYEELSKDNSIATLTVTLTPSDKVIEISSVLLPDGQIVNNKTNLIYEVQENGEYTFIIEYKIVSENEKHETIEIDKKEKITYYEKNIQDLIKEDVNQNASNINEEIDDVTLKQQNENSNQKNSMLRAGDIPLDEEHFPDENFRYWLSINTTPDQIKGYGEDGVFTKEELADITYINFANKEIESLKGIEYFTALTKLDCYNNKLTALDISHNTALTSLQCAKNSLNALDINQNPKLTYLDCSSNQIASLNVTQNKEITDLFCYNNKLTTLNLINQTKLNNVRVDKQTREVPMAFSDTSWKSSPTSLYELDSIDANDITYNNSTKVFTTNSTNTILSNFNTNCIDGNGAMYTISGTLQFIYDGLLIDQYNFPDNNFRNYLLNDTNGIKGYGKDSIFTMEELSNIINIGVANRNISTLQGIEHFNNLSVLWCDNNKLTLLDVSKNKALTDLRCYVNQIIALDVSQNPALIELNCYNNKIRYLDVSNNLDLIYFTCDTNLLETLDVTNNKALKKLNCGGNKLTTLDVSQNLELIDLRCNNNALLTIDISKLKKVTTIMLQNQKREIPMVYSDHLWKSDDVVYELGKIDASEITYNSLTGQFHVDHAAIKESGFTTDCIDGSGIKYAMTGTLHFIYDGFIPVTNIKDVPKVIQIGEALALTGTIEPSNATVPATIVWSIKDAGETNAVLKEGILTVQKYGTIVITATSIGGNEKGDYTQDFTIIVLQEPSTLVSIPSAIILEKVNNDTMFEAIKEESISILSTTDTDIYHNNFYVQTQPSFPLLNIEDNDEWFIVQIYDENNQKHTANDTPLAILNGTTKMKKFYLKAFKDLSKKKGIYEGTMNFIIGYGES